MKAKKIKLRIEDMSFELPSECLRTTSWGGKPVEPFIYLRAKHVATLIKQYMKKKYPSVVCSAVSEVYSGGDSVNIYLSDERGNPIADEIVKDVDRFGTKFEEGSFNGMIDMYEYRDEELSTDNDTKINGGVKYLFVNNRPKFGTVPDVVKMIKDYQAGKYVGGVRDLAGSIKEVMRYGVTQSTVDKALKLM